MRTKTLTIGETDLTISRPAYRAMRDHAEIFENLYGADSPREVLFGDDFQKIIPLICATPEDVEKLQELDVNEVWQLWEEFVAFARLQDFFHGAAEAQRVRSSALFTAHMQAAQSRMELMRKAGFAPKDLPTISDVDLVTPVAE